VNIAFDVAVNRGYTALHFAAQVGHIEVMDMLVAAGGDLFALNSAGDTPLQVAKKSNAYLTLHTSDIHAKHVHEWLFSHTNAAALAVLREAAQTASSRYKYLSRSDVQFAALLLNVGNRLRVS